MTEAAGAGPGVERERAHVLILNWNGWKDTLECLESVFRLDWDDLRVIVCDNGSTDGSLDRIREWARGERPSPPTSVEALRALTTPPVPKPIAFAEYTRTQAESGGDRRAEAPLILIDVGENVGFAGGTNVGLRYLRTRREPGVVWVLNNDMVVAPDSLVRMIDVMHRPPAVDCVGATILEYDDPDRVQYSGGGVIKLWQGMPGESSAVGARRGTPQAIPERLDYVSGGCMVLRVETLAKAGLIDERYFLYGEDVDFSLQIRARGMRLGHSPGAEVWHKGGAAVGHRSPFHDYYMVRSALLLVHKFRPWLLPFTLAFVFYRCTLPKLVRGQGDRLRAVLRAHRDFVSSIRGGERVSTESAATDLSRAVPPSAEPNLSA